MMKPFCLLLVVVGFAVGLHAQTPWPHVAFTEVRAYAWPNDPETESVIGADRSLQPRVINPEGALLTEAEAKQLLAAVTGKHAEHVVASCHVPHNAFVFYDAAHKPVAFVEICFGCLNHRMDPALGAAEYPDLIALASIFEAHHLPMGAYANVAEFKEHYKAFGGDK